MARRKMRVAVVGAGAFGGWTALHLLRAKTDVTLLDAWGAGNPRASSGGETRIIRGAYGPDPLYSTMAARAFRIWRECEQRWKKKLLYPTGVLFMAAAGDDAWERASLPPLKDAGIPCQRLSATQLKKQWPQINFEGIDWGLYEPESGYVTARAACQAVLESFIAEGGAYRQAAAQITEPVVHRLHGLTLEDGSTVRADRYVMACGPWMGNLFPLTIGGAIRATKQDVFFFGTSPGDARFDEGQLPVWADHREPFMYGIPGNEVRPFKIADDTRGEIFDPTLGDRVIDPRRLRRAREYVEFRFPGLRGAPLIKGRVCQYEQTPDSDFIIDRHPENPNVWLIGGGSGHGFKHGPAVGELVAELVLKDGETHPRFRLDRFRGQVRHIRDKRDGLSRAILKLPLGCYFS